MKTKSKRRGFSLAEILVSVAIMAVVAAVVIPSIGGQLNKGDTARVSSDLISVRSAVEQFLADVRRYPSAMSQLQTKPGFTAADTGINSSGVFTTAQVARWRGPYMTKDFSASAVTGFGQQMVVQFSVCNAALLCTAAATGQKYLTVLIPGLSSREMFLVDSTMDDGVQASGQIQFVTSGVDTLKYLALPIQ